MTCFMSQKEIKRKFKKIQKIKIDHKCLVMEKDFCCSNKDLLFIIFSDGIKRTEILIDFALFLRACQILNIDFEKNVLDDNEMVLIEKELKCFNVETETELIKEELQCYSIRHETDRPRIFSDQDRKILLKHYLECHACRMIVGLSDEILFLPEAINL